MNGNSVPLRILCAPKKLSPGAEPGHSKTVARDPANAGWSWFDTAITHGLFFAVLGLLVSVHASWLRLMRISRFVTFSGSPQPSYIYSRKCS